MPDTKLVAIVALIVMALLLLNFLLKKSRDNSNPINIDDLLLERGPDGSKQLSKIACYLLGAFLVSSWVVVYQLMQGTLTDLCFGAYLTAWVAPLLTKIVKGDANATPSA